MVLRNDENASIYNFYFLKKNVSIILHIKKKLDKMNLPIQKVSLNIQ